MHESFLKYAGYRWLKISTGLMLVCIAGYLLVDVSPRHNGGSWYGYVLGYAGLLLILWLTMLGIRKRAITRGTWSLKAWTSAHVYLGLSLIVIGTLHTGFQFGLDIHTAAYVFMMIVVISGMVGTYFYARIPAKLSDNRDEMTEMDMLGSVRSLDRQLHDAAQPLPAIAASVVVKSLEQSPFDNGIFQRLSGRYSDCATHRAQQDMERERTYQQEKQDEQLGELFDKVDALLEKKAIVLVRLRRHLQLKAMLQAWLFIHVPMTFALIASLFAHIIIVTFFW